MSHTSPSDTLQNRDHPALASAKRTIAVELSALKSLDQVLTLHFVHLVETITSLDGHVVIMGLGKSGHIGRKISASLSSTGTPSFFVHPTEAGHGDLGMITNRDLLLVLSNSGEQDELNLILPLIKRNNIKIAAITSKSTSSLAKYCDFLLLTPLAQEACPHNLAPTTSTMLQLVLGDALVVACLESRRFSKTDFAHSHPSGAIGRRLTLQVANIMQTQALPVASVDTTVHNAMSLMSSSGLGFACTVDQDYKPNGIFTDGDLRRMLLKGESVLDTNLSQVISPSPKSISHHALAQEALSLMEACKITSLLVIDDEAKLVGAINMNSLLKAKII